MKIRTQILVLAALAAGTVAVPALAAETAGPWYVGGGFGKSFSSGGNTTFAVPGFPTVIATTSGFDSNKTSFQLFGGYQFTPIWGVEVQYTGLGKRSGTATLSGGATGTVAVPDTKFYQYGIAGTGTLAIDDNWFARGKLGVSSNHIDGTTVTFPGGFYSTGSSSKTDLLAGAAIGYRWNANVSTRLEYEYFGKFQGNNSSGNASVKGNNLGLRLQYNF